MITKAELQDLADDVILNWNLDLGGDRRKAFYRTWYRYMQDLEYVEVRKAIDELIITDKPFPPRAGTVRRMVRSGALIGAVTVDQAWAQAKDRIGAVQQGTWTEVAPLVGQALLESGIKGVSREDHEAFTRAWRKVVEEFELRILGLPPELDEGED